MEGARRARPDDLAPLVDLAREAASQMVGERGGSLWALSEARPEPIQAELAELVEGSDHTFAAVGLVDDAIVGYALMRAEPLHDSSTLAVVSDIYVTPQARGVGVGEALMDLLVQVAQTWGAVGIDSLALPGDRATKNFFERFGLKARAIVVHRALGPARDGAEPDHVTGPDERPDRSRETPSGQEMPR